MPKKSTITKMKKIERLVEKYEAVRKELKASGNYGELSQLPRNSNPNRLKRLCKLTGRSRGVYRKFGISRIKIRELADKGFIPGLKKSSW
ncbi:MAG: 30S ribosomal protein S14 [Planctomycetota bacterium]